jgi:hypothetical protein
MIDSTHGFSETAFHFRAKIIHKNRRPAVPGVVLHGERVSMKLPENQVVSGL